ncbi:MAG TPA: hypothetical protein VIA62_15185 [Thermoanaerobaculia bacterium]|jgi:hypothetical protein|nr:hypothetical protein [Thermoanaerobaculia bacterium]
MTSGKRSALLFLALILAGSAVFAQGQINRLQIVIKDIGSREDVASVEPGGTVDLPRGGPVRVILSALYSGGKTIYPVTSFSDPVRGGIAITRSNPENAAADLDLSGATGQREQINFLITDGRVPNDLRRGSFYVRVVRGAGGSREGGGDRRPQGGGEYGGGPREGGGYGEGSRGARWTRMLYQAILLRDPDPGAAGTVLSLEQGGYDALVRAAEGIADSDESRVRIYENGNVTNERRLISLYRNLLGLAPEDVNRSTWDRDLRRLNDGQIAAVVRDLVRSDRFRTRLRERDRY